MIVIHADTRGLARDLNAAAQKQIPFANALALNKLAKRVIERQTQNLSDTFDNPRKFTENAFTQSRGFGGMYATKALPVAIIVAKPIQAAYLAPSEQPKEVQALQPGKQKIRTPVGVKTNVHGNIPRGKLVELLARPDVFLGEVRGVNGIWQRSKRGTRRRGGYGTKGKLNRIAGFATTLKLLVAFTRPKHIKTDLQYGERAREVIDAHWQTDFDAALGEALASAK